MNKTRLVFLLIILAVCCLLAALVNLLLLEVPSDLPFHLFHISLLIFSLVFMLEFRKITDFFSRTYFWFGPRQAFRVGLLTLVFIFALLISYQKPLRFDWTEEGVHTLDPASLKLWDSLDFSLEVYSDPIADSGSHRLIKQFLESLGSSMPEVQIDWIHPLKEPGKLGSRGIKTLPAWVVTLKDKGSLTLERHQLMTRSRGTGGRVRFLGETALNQALMRLNNRQKLTLSWPSKTLLPVFDPSPGGYSELLSMFKADGYQCLTTNTLSLSPNPVMVFLPDSPLPVAQQKLLMQRKKASLATVLIYETQPQDPLRQAHETWKLNFYPHPVADPLRPVGRELSWVRPQSQGHPITQGLDLLRFPVIFAGVSSFSCSGSKMKPVLKSSAISWSERSLEGSGLPIFNPDQDLKGPLSLVCELAPGFLLIGDQDFLSNQFLELAGNRSLILNALNHSLNKPELLGQRVRELEVRRIQSTHQTNKVFIVFTLILLPAVCFSIAAILYLLGQRNT